MLQQDLAGLLSKDADCKLKISEKLIDKLINNADPAMAQPAGKEWKSAPFGQRDLACTSDSGTEIKEEQVIRADPGYYFADVRASEAAPTVSYAGGQIGCTELGRETAEMQKVVNGKDTKVKVTVAIRVFAHADCGSGMRSVLSGWKITAFCQAVGTIVPWEQ